MQCARYIHTADTNGRALCVSLKRQSDGRFHFGFNCTSQTAAHSLMSIWHGEFGCDGRRQWQMVASLSPAHNILCMTMQCVLKRSHGWIGCCDAEHSV